MYLHLVSETRNQRTKHLALEKVLLELGEVFVESCLHLLDVEQ